VSEDTNIKSLGEKVKKIKNKLHLLTLIFYLLTVLLFIWITFTVLVFYFYSAPVGDINGYIVLFLTIAAAILISIGHGKLNKHFYAKWTMQEEEAKKRLLKLLYPNPNCSYCGNPLAEGSKFCTYCGNKQQY
jgi:hypothetical protein